MVSFCVAFRAFWSRFTFRLSGSLTLGAFGLLGCLFDDFDLVVILILLQEVLLMGNSLRAGNDRLDELSVHRHLPGRTTQGFLAALPIDTCHFEKNASGPDHSHPILRVAFA